MASLPRGRRPLWLVMMLVSAACLTASLLRLWPSVPSSLAEAAWSACCDPSAAMADPFRPMVARVWVGMGLVIAGRAVLRAARRLRRTRALVASVGRDKATVPRYLSRMLTEERLAHRVDLVEGRAPFAFCHGLIRPRICISRGLIGRLKPSQVRAVLIHEHHHVVNLHPLQGLLFGFVADALFFLPVLADVRDSHEASCELAADRHAIERTGRDALAGAILRMIGHSGLSRSLDGLAVSGLNVTRARVDQILGAGPARSTLSLHRTALTAAALAAGCLVWMTALA